jgi:hypothetical protein
MEAASNFMTIMGRDCASALRRAHLPGEFSCARGQGDEPAR